MVRAPPCHGGGHEFESRWPRKTFLSGRRSKMAKNNNTFGNEFLSRIKWGESYTSLILGAIVVLVAAVLIIMALKNNFSANKETGSTSTNSNQTKIYTVKQGDDLWHIAESLYGSGYNWVDLAKANKITNADQIEAGTKLTVPDVKKIKPETTPTTVASNDKITGNSYTVKQGDNLWDIAVRKYNDGYKWTQIAQVNKLVNPDLIFVGDKISLP